ncbi:MAG: SAM-dependent methyltransferase [Gammaproteobacteria bacterium]|nr:SAM-dependent methyltransferase [Gammaproteobacteria bacterium]
MTRSTFLELTAEQQQHAEHCTKCIAREIRERGGSIGFDEYMQLILHDHSVGYYHTQQPVFGEQGDFVTVPETSVHLAYCIAHACAGLIRDDAQRCILEIGAGRGQLVLDVIRCLHAWGITPRKYYIFEPSKVLRATQRELLEKQMPEAMSVVEWLPDLQAALGSVLVIANEVLDALPVKCFVADSQQIKERCVVSSEQGGLGWQVQDPSYALDAALDYLTVMLDSPPTTDVYCSEINLELETTLDTWSNCCEQCIMFLIDYGYPQSEYYHPQRNMGTLRSYFRHQVSENPFVYPGLQDITADVNFSALAKAATRLNMGVLSFGSQRNFMLANSLLDWRPTGKTEAEQVAQVAQLKQLTLGSAVGERFQVMVLGKGIEYGPDRFTLRDMRARL